MKKLFFVFLLVSCGSAAEHKDSASKQTSATTTLKNIDPQSDDYRLDFTDIVALAKTTMTLSLTDNVNDSYAIKKDGSFSVLNTPKGYNFYRSIKAKTGSLVEFKQETGRDLLLSEFLVYWLPKNQNTPDLLKGLEGNNFLGENSLGDLYFKPRYEAKERDLTVYHPKDKTMSVVKTSIPNADYTTLSKDCLVIYNNTTNQIFHTVLDIRRNISATDIASITSTQILISNLGQFILDMNDGSLVKTDTKVTVDAIRKGVERDDNQLISTQLTYDEGGNVYRQLIAINGLEVSSLLDLRPFQTDLSDQMFVLNNKKFAFKGLNKIYLAEANKDGGYDVSLIVQNLNITALDVSGPYIMYSAEDEKGNAVVASYDTNTGKTNTFSNSIIVKSINSL